MPPEERYWYTDFETTKKQDETIGWMFEEFLKEAAAICNLDTSEWDSDDFDVFRDIIL